MVQKNHNFSCLLVEILFQISRKDNVGLFREAVNVLCDNEEKILTSIRQGRLGHVHTTIKNLIKEKTLG